jgi:uncharacterized protein YbjT (DUF2867 family)
LTPLAVIGSRGPWGRRREAAGRAFAVTGPEVLTQVEQVRAIGAAIGRDLLVEEQSPDIAAPVRGRHSSPSSPSAPSRTGPPFDAPERATDDVERVTGRPARSFAEWTRDHVDDFAA